MRSHLAEAAEQDLRHLSPEEEARIIRRLAKHRAQQLKHTALAVTFKRSGRTS